MDVVFLKLLNISISAGWLILAVLVLRLILKKAPKWLSCVLWGLVAIRLICPFSFESIFSLIPSAETIDPYVVRYAQEPAIDSGIPFLANAFNPIINHSFAPAPGASVNPLYVWLFIAGIVWGIGLIGMLGYAIVSLLRLRFKVREAVFMQDKVWLCDLVKSPFILGFIHPRIYLPSDIREETICYVLAHEQAHLKRKDHLWKLLGYLLLAVYWFHPLVWAAYILLCRDMELACDEKVIKDMNMDGKKAYSHALVSLSIQRNTIAACPLAFGEVGVKERVKAVLNYKKPAFWIIAAAIICCIVMAVCFLTNPKNNVYSIRITIPAGSQGAFAYSDEEISPLRNKITISSGEGLGDTEVVLLPTEVREENAYDAPTYLTPGMPIKMTAEKGGWFKIGVSVQNPTEKDIDVYVRVEGVEVRIASYAVSYDERPMLMMDGMAYVDPYMPVSRLPYGYTFAGTLTAEQAYNTGMEGLSYFTHPGSTDDFYVYQECGTPIDINTVDSTQLQWAYVRWIQVNNDGIEHHKLTLDDVILLSRKGDDLTWSDFDSYSYYETGSGLYIRVYEIDDMFSVWIGGGSPGTAMYFYLRSNDGTEAYIDIRTGDVEAFIAEHEKNPIVTPEKLTSPVSVSTEGKR